MFGFLLHTHTYLCVPSGRYVICTMDMGTEKEAECGCSKGVGTVSISFSTLQFFFIFFFLWGREG